MTSRIRRRNNPTLEHHPRISQKTSALASASLLLLVLCCLVPTALALESRQLLGGNIFDTSKPTAIATADADADTKTTNSVGFLDPAFRDDNGLLLDYGEGDGNNNNIDNKQILTQGEVNFTEIETEIEISTETEATDETTSESEASDNDGENDAEILFDDDNVVALDSNETETGLEENITVTNPGSDEYVDIDSNSTLANATDNDLQSNATGSSDPSPMDDETTATGTGPGTPPPTDSSDTDTGVQSNATTTPISVDGNTTMTTAPTTTKILVVTINSSFVVATPTAPWTESLDPLEAAPQQHLENLTEAFGEMARIVVMGLNTKIVDSNNNTVVRRYSYLRRRRELQLERQLQSSTLVYVPESATIIGLLPTTDPCPTTLPNGSSVTPFNGSSACLTAFAQYNVSVEDDGGNKNEYRDVYDTLVSETQTAIDQGGLQEELVKLDPNSIFTVQAAAVPVTLPPPPATTTATTEPTPAPETQPPAPKAKNDTVKIILIVLFVITSVIVALLLVLYFYLKRADEEDAIEKHTDEDEAGENSDPEQAPMLEGSSLDGDADKGVNSNPDGSSHMFLTPSTDFEQHQNNYIQRVEELVAENCPEETPNISSILEQFKGREEALISMLQNMDAVERELLDSSSRSDDNDSDEEHEGLPLVEHQDAKEEEKDEIENDPALRDEGSRDSEAVDDTMG